MKEFRILPDDPRLTAYALGELDSPEREAVEAALQAQPALRATVEELRATAARIEDALAVEAALPELNLCREPLLPSAGPPLEDHRPLNGAVPRRKRPGGLLRFPQLYVLAGGLAAAAFVVLIAWPDRPTRPRAASLADLATTEHTSAADLAKPAVPPDTALTETALAADVAWSDPAVRAPEALFSTAAPPPAPRSNAPGTLPVSDAWAPPSDGVVPQSLQTATVLGSALLNEPPPGSPDRTPSAPASGQTDPAFPIGRDNSAPAAAPLAATDLAPPPLALSPDLRLSTSDVFQIPVTPVRPPPPLGNVREEPASQALVRAQTEALQIASLRAAGSEAERARLMEEARRRVAPPPPRPAAARDAATVDTRAAAPVTGNMRNDAMDTIRTERGETTGDTRTLALARQPAAETVTVSGSRPAPSARTDLFPGRPVLLPIVADLPPGSWRDPAAGTYAPRRDNDFLSAAQHPLSTFGLAVEPAAYATVRDFLRQGRWPPPGAVRIEELVNHFSYTYDPPGDSAPLAAAIEVAAAPWAPFHRLVRIGLQPPPPAVLPGEPAARPADRAVAAIARDVSVFVEFNPATVASYRLIGYDHAAPQPGGVEIAAGHAVTALYEIVPAWSAAPPAAAGGFPIALKYQPARGSRPGPSTGIAGELLTLTVRYRDREGGPVRALEFPLADSGAAFAHASADFRFAAAVAAFGMILRDSPHRGGATMSHVVEWASAARDPAADPRAQRAEFIDLARRAQQLLER
jgi:hypothetical protein